MARLCLRCAATEASGQSHLTGAASERATISIDGASKGLAFLAQDGPPALRLLGRHRPQTRLWRGLHPGSANHYRQFRGRGVRSDSSRMDIETRRGANGLHGQGFFFARQNAWGRKEPLHAMGQRNCSGPPASTPPPLPSLLRIPYSPSGSAISTGAPAWAATSAATSSSGLPLLDGYRRNDPGLATVKHPDQFFAQPVTTKAGAL